MTFDPFPETGSSDGAGQVGARSSAAERPRARSRRCGRGGDLDFAGDRIAITWARCRSRRSTAAREGARAGRSAIRHGSHRAPSSAEAVGEGGSVEGSRRPFLAWVSPGQGSIRARRHGAGGRGAPDADRRPDEAPPQQERPTAKARIGDGAPTSRTRPAAGRVRARPVVPVAR